MSIKLTNSQAHLWESFGINMQEIGATDRVSHELSNVAVWSAWEYDYEGDFMLITIVGVGVPDLHAFGEVVNDDDSDR